MWRIVIFTGELNYSVRKGIIDIINAFPAIELLVLHEEKRLPLQKRVRLQYKYLKANGVRWVGYQIGKLLKYRSNKKKCLSKEADKKPGWVYTVHNISAKENVDYIKVNDIHGQDVIDLVRKFRPDLGVSLAAPILKPRLFEIPKNGTINLHKGKLPQYRGMPPAFWEMWNREKEVGCTIHMVSEKLDQGDILFSKVIPIPRFSTPGGLVVRLDEVGSRMTVKAIDAVLTGKAKTKKQVGDGNTYKRPTLKQESILRKRIQQKKSYSLLRHYGKEILFSLYVNPYKYIVGKWSCYKKDQHISVLLYHRVNDDMRDPLTVGVEQFDKQMEMIKERYTVVSIEDVISGHVDRAEQRPIVAVTFDDGYLDNYEYAVPILLKHRIPAAFFVTTGLIGTNRGFEHDRKKLGYYLDNMTWENLVEMKEHGFVIGSHTVTHINCGKHNKQKVKEEIEESLETIKHKLNIENVIFAYPFGKKDDITEEIREFVKKCGYTGCLSAYGGVNKKIDKYNVKRFGVDSQFTLRALRAHIEGFTNKSN